MSLKCNLDCSFCCQQERRYEQEDELNFQQIIQIIDHLPSNAHLSFLWWETLIFPKIREVFAYLETTHITWEITTNGTMFPTFWKDLISYKNLSQINISIDGYEKVHDISRWSPNLFATIIESIKKINNKKPILVSTVITDITDKNLVNLYKTLSQLQVKDHKLIYCMDFSEEDINNSKKYIPHLLVWKPGHSQRDEKAYKQDFLKKIFLLRNLNLNTQVTFEPSWLFTSWEKYCKQINEQYRINEKWEISICEFIKNSYWSLLTHSFEEIIINKKYTSMKEKIRQYFPLNICDSCCKNSKK